MLEATEAETAPQAPIEQETAPGIKKKQTLSPGRRQRLAGWLAFVFLLPLKIPKSFTAKGTKGSRIMTLLISWKSRDPEPSSKVLKSFLSAAKSCLQNKP